MAVQPVCARRRSSRTGSGEAEQRAETGDNSKHWERQSRKLDGSSADAWVGQEAGSFAEKDSWSLVPLEI